MAAAAGKRQQSVKTDRCHGLSAPMVDRVGTVVDVCCPGQGCSDVGTRPSPRRARSSARGRTATKRAACTRPAVPPLGQRPRCDTVKASRPASSSPCSRAGGDPQGAPTSSGRYRCWSPSPLTTPTLRVPTRQPMSRPFTRIGLPDARRARERRRNRLERASASPAGARSRVRASGVTAEAVDPSVAPSSARSRCLP